MCSRALCVQKCILSRKRLMSSYQSRSFSTLIYHTSLVFSVFRKLHGIILWPSPSSSSPVFIIQMNLFVRMSACSSCTSNTLYTSVQCVKSFASNENCNISKIYSPRNWIFILAFGEIARTAIPAACSSTVAIAHRIDSAIFAVFISCILSLSLPLQLFFSLKY